MNLVLQRILHGLQIAVTALLALLLACNVYLIFARQVLGIAHPTVFGYSAAVVVSGSMEPALSVDDMVLNHAQDHYQVGDIITFAKGDSLTTHRVVTVSGTDYLTRGDANNAPDPDSVPQQNVVGRVIAVIPGVGRLFFALKTPLGLTLLVFVGFLLLELPFLFHRAAQHNERGESQA